MSKDLVTLRSSENTLAGVAVGGSATVHSVDPSDSALQCRLTQLGFIPGTLVQVVRTAPLGDPIEIELRGFRLSLSRREARRVKTGPRLAQSTTAERYTGNAGATYPIPSTADAPQRVLFVGNPNTGKSTLFSALSGRHASQANHPGITVDRLEASLTTKSGRALRLVDLPGTYGMLTTSPEERITIDALRSELAADPHTVAVLVLDATTLARGLHLALELRELAPRLVVAVNMLDEAEKQGLQLDLVGLSDWLGAPVVGTIARTGVGFAELLQQIETAPRREWICRGPSEPIALMQARYAFIDEALPRFQRRPTRPARLTDRVDAVLTHPVWGSLSFVMLLLALFGALFSWSDPAMRAIQAGFDALSTLLQDHVPRSFVSRLLIEGVIGGVGTVLTFLPQILLLLCAVTVLEGVGYLSRAAFLIDRLMRVFGLSGKAFVPMLSGFACAVPAIFALRTLERRRDRLLTMAVIPLFSCSARLPIYSLIIAVLFDAGQTFWGLPIGAWLLLAVYLTSTAFAFAALYVLSRVVRTESAPFVLELPPYRLPKLDVVARTLWLRSKDFLGTAGTLIVALSAVMWILLHVPAMPDDMPEGEALEHSVAGKLGHAIEPIITPLGFDWRIGVGVIGSFAAREVFVATMGVLHGAAAEKDDLGGLPQALREARRSDGTMLYSPRVGLSLVLFFMLACQCMSTLSVMRRETGSWRWPAFVFTYMTVLAYVVAFAAYQITGLAGLP